MVYHVLMDRDCAITAAMPSPSLDLRLRGAARLLMCRGVRRGDEWHLTRAEPLQTAALCGVAIAPEDVRLLAQWCRPATPTDNFCPRCGREPVALLAIAAQLLLVEPAALEYA